MNISTVDIVVFSSYCLLILFIGLYVSREKKGKEKNEEKGLGGGALLIFY